ncbi:MAG: heat-inducible transcriptional repressor HrcA [Deltaproteobacteria bacterium]
MVQLSDRAKKILNLIIEQYIKTSEPVGSSPLVKNYHLDMSSATVRSTMSELMNKGYLAQPHVSAGRVPTEKGIRLYVESLPHPHELSEEKRVVIKMRYRKLSGTIDEVLHETTKMLSDISHCAGLVTLPRARFMKIESAKLVKLGSKRILVIIVFQGGLTEKTLVNVDKTIPDDMLERISDYLNNLAVGLSLDEMRDSVVTRLKDERRIYRDFVERVINFGDKIEGKSASDVYIKGQAAMFENSFANNPQAFRELFKTFEERDFLVEILDKVMKEDGTKVFVGSTMGIAGYSLVAASYGKDRRLGTLGVFGPMYMDYSEIIPLVDYTAGIVTKIVSEGEYND